MCWAGGSSGACAGRVGALAHGVASESWNGRCFFLVRWSAGSSEFCLKSVTISVFAAGCSASAWSVLRILLVVNDRLSIFRARAKPFSGRSLAPGWQAPSRERFRTVRIGADRFGCGATRAPKALNSTPEPLNAGLRLKRTITLHTLPKAPKPEPQNPITFNQKSITFYENRVFLSLAEMHVSWKMRLRLKVQGLGTRRANCSAHVYSLKILK